MNQKCSVCGSTISVAIGEPCPICAKKRTEELKPDESSNAKNQLIYFAAKLKNVASEASKEMRSEETKEKFRNLAGQVKNVAAKAANDLKEEAHKINEARKATASEADSLKADTKLGTTKAIGLSFLSKLTGKQKVLLIAVPSIVIMLVGTVWEEASEKHDCQTLSSKIKKVSNNFIDASKLENPDVNGKCRLLQENLMLLNSIDTRKAADQCPAFEKEYGSVQVARFKGTTRGGMEQLGCKLR